jgi:hypothetical protein
MPRRAVPDLSLGYVGGLSMWGEHQTTADRRSAAFDPDGGPARHRRRCWAGYAAPGGARRVTCRRLIRAWASWCSREAMGVVDYRVQPDAALTAIAAKLDLGLSAVEAANHYVMDPDQIFPDGLMHIPDLRAPAHDPAPVPPHVMTNTVQPDDAISASAAAHSIRLAALEAANPQVANPNRIHPGKFVPSPQPPPRTMDRRRAAGDRSGIRCRRARWRFIP